MNRRYLLNTLGLAAGACALPPYLHSELSCVDNYFSGVRTCEAGIDSDRMDTVYTSQRRSQWCWAACIEMVFEYWGHSVTQKRIVERTWGSDVNMPAQPNQIIRDLNRRWVDDNDEAFRVRGDVFSANAITAAQDLANDMPLILGSLGHAMVLTAMTYQAVPNPLAAATVIEATVRDPWPGEGKRSLTPRERAGTMLLARIRVY